MKVTLHLSRKDIKTLGDELNYEGSGSSELLILIEKILRAVDKTAKKNEEKASEIDKVNPFHAAEIKGAE
jgi:hypothetical protein